eukprot:c16944_g1_i3.p1 GENE.c16944_g1_i3~~c16944_g1_i3.p1  ORF type:complete len:465 (-),score=103.74 c16944_g1_i3:10-1404(-)
MQAELATLVAALKDPAATQDETIDYIRRVQEESHSADVLTDLGAIETLIDLANCKIESVSVEALAALGQLSFRFCQAASRAGQSQILVNLVKSIVATQQTNLRLRDTAVYATKNVAVFSWASHPNLLQLVPSHISILDLVPEVPENIKFLQRCAGLFRGLATNPDSRAALHGFGVVAALRRRTFVDSGIEMSRIITLAFLVGDDDTNPVLATPQVAQTLIAAFKASLVRAEYPHGSSWYYTDWHLAGALQNLCQSETNRQILVRFDITNAFRYALESSSDDRLLVPCLSSLALLAREPSGLIEITSDRRVMTGVHKLTKNLAEDSRIFQAVAHFCSVLELRPPTPTPAGPRSQTTPHSRANSKCLITLCYSLTDKNVVRLCREHLQSSFEFWTAEEEDSPDSGTLAAVTNAILHSGAVLLFVSSACRDSHACRIQVQFCFCFLFRLFCFVCCLFVFFSRLFLFH